MKENAVIPASQPYMELVKTIEYLGGSAEDLHCIVTNPKLRVELADRILGRTRCSATPVFGVLVDHQQDLQKMIHDGKYDQCSKAINARNFVKQGQGVVQVYIELVYLGNKGFDGFANATAILNQRGLRPITLEELLALGQQYPAAQCEYTIAALGSIWTDQEGKKFCPILGRSSGFPNSRSAIRQLYLRWEQNFTYHENHIAVTRIGSHC